jgi:hypothetical protein
MPDIDVSGGMVMRVVPEVISILDYSKGFGHADLVTVAPEEIGAAA